MDERVQSLFDCPHYEDNYKASGEIFDALRAEACERVRNTIDERHMTKREVASLIDCTPAALTHNIRIDYPIRGTYAFLKQLSHNFLNISCHELLFNSDDVCILPPEESVIANILEKMTDQELNTALSVANDIQKEAENHDGLLSARTENYCIYHRGLLLAKELCISPIYLPGKDTIREVRRILRCFLEPYNLRSDDKDAKGLLRYNTLMYLSLFTHKTIDYYIDWNFIERNRVGYYPITYYDRTYRFTHEVEQINAFKFFSALAREMDPNFEERLMVDFRKNYDFSPDVCDISPNDNIEKYLPVIMTYHFANNEASHVVTSWKILSILQTLMVLDEEYRNELFGKLYLLFLDHLF